MRQRSVSGNTVMFLEAAVCGGAANETADCAAAVIIITAEQVGVIAKTPHTRWPSSSLMAEPYTIVIPSFLSLESSKREAHAVLASLPGLSPAQMSFHSEKLANFLSSAAKAFSLCGSKSLLITVDLQLFTPLGEEEIEELEEEETRSGKDKF